MTKFEICLKHRDILKDDDCRIIFSMRAFDLACMRNCTHVNRHCIFAAIEFLALCCSSSFQIEIRENETRKFNHSNRKQNKKEIARGKKRIENSSIYICSSLRTFYLYQKILKIGKINFSRLQKLEDRKSVV